MSADSATPIAMLVVSFTFDQLHVRVLIFLVASRTQINDCLWSQQPSSTALLYTLHIGFATMVAAHWAIDAVSLRHTTRQVMFLEKVTFLCTQSSEVWYYVVILVVLCVAFAIWIYEQMEL